MASQRRPPFLVTPNDMASTPARQVATIDGGVRGGECGQGERIGRRPGGDRKDLDRMLEDLGEAALDPGGPVVAAIAEGGSLIRRRQRCDHLRRGAAGIVAAKV